MDSDSATSSGRKPAGSDAHEAGGSGDERGDRSCRYTSDLGDAANTGNKSTASRLKSNRTLLGDSCTDDKCDICDCIDYDRLRHHVGLLVKTANLGKWFPPWTVTRTAWNAALTQTVSGISTDVVLFSEHGAQLVHHYLSTVLHRQWRQTFPVLLPLPCFTAQDFALDLVTTPSHLVVDTLL